MAGLLKPPGFGTNSWQDVPWSKAQAMTGPRFVVADSTAWRPTAVSTADRTVSIAKGAAMGCGVYDETAGPETLQLAPNTGSGNRYDMIVARWTWGATRTRVFAVIQGGIFPPQGNTTQTVNAGEVNRIPGVQYDAVIALVTVRPNVGTLLAADVLDVRVWGGGDGVSVTPRLTGLPYLDAGTGDVVLPEDTGTTPRLKTANGAWRPLDGNWGSGSTFPTSPLRTGDIYRHGTYRCTMMYVGNPDFWRQVDIAEVTSNADRVAYLGALSSAGLQMHNGFQLFQSDADQFYVSPGGSTVIPVGGRSVPNRAARDALVVRNGDHVYQEDIDTELVYRAGSWRLATPLLINTDSTGGTVPLESLAWQGFTQFDWVPRLGQKQVFAADGIARQWKVEGTAHIVGDMWMRIRVDAPGEPSKYFPKIEGARITAPTNTEQTWMSFGHHFQTATRSATFYLEAHAHVQGSGGIYYPQLTLTAY